MGPKSAVQSPETNGDNGKVDNIDLPGVPDFTGLSPMPLTALANSSEKLEKLKSIALKFPGSPASPKKKPATPKTPKEPKEPKAPRERSFGANGVNPIVFEKTYECVGTWKKTIQARSTGNHVDPYLYPPDGKKLRSGNELIDYISKNPQFWADFDPVVINFERSEDVKMGGASKKLIKFLDLVRNGSTTEEALENCQHIPKDKKPPRPSPKPKDGSVPKSKLPKKGSIPTDGPKIKIGPKSRMSSDGGGSGGVKIKIGPKSKMARLEGKLNREVVDTLERYFDANKTKPSDGQMITWASELKVPFDDVHEWFYKKWKGKLEYEYQKNKQKEDFGVSERSREVKSFEPTAAPPSDDEELDGIFGIECDVEIVNENAEDDDEY